MRFPLGFAALTLAALSLLGCAGSTPTAKEPSSTTNTSSTSGCQPVTCEVLCTYGFEKDANGCEICKCAAPPEGQPACEPVTCEIKCENGFATDDRGCETCACK